MSKSKNLTDQNGGGLKRELGLVAATSIVIGNVIGSGIFMSPATMARVSNPKAAIVAWLITAIGSIFIGLNFANLGSKIPKTGGPIAYTRAAFGDFAAYLIAWTYWVGAWVGNAAIITAFMSYFTYFVPGAANPTISFIITSAILWLFTLVNLYGVKNAGIISVVTTVLKVGALVVFIIIALFKFNPKYFNTISSTSPQGWSGIAPGIGVALWAFVGIESATIPAGEIKNPERNVKLSTIYGTIIVAVIYILISVVSMGGMNQEALANSNAPFADIINNATGATWGGTFIAVGAVISTLGAISGWLLTTARCAYGAAEDKIFPKVFSRVSGKYNTPTAALIISGILTNLVLILNYTEGLKSAFDFMTLLATLAFLPAYSFCAVAEILLLVKHSKDFNLWNFLKNSFLSLLAFAYSIYAIYGTGMETVTWGFILMLLGIPLYVYLMLQNNKEDKNVDKLRKEAGLTED